MDAESEPGMVATFIYQFRRPICQIQRGRTIYIDVKVGLHIESENICFHVICAVHTVMKNNHIKAKQKSDLGHFCLQSEWSISGKLN